MIRTKRRTGRNRKKDKQKENIPKCQYCEIPAIIADISAVKPDIKTHEKIYLCPKCGAYVYIKTDNNPPGRLADEKLRKKRQQTHVVFDLLWETGIMDRHSAYKWLADKLLIPYQHAHISEFGIYMCDQTIKESLTALRSNKNKNVEESILSNYQAIQNLERYNMLWVLSSINPTSKKGRNEKI